MSQAGGGFPVIPPGVGILSLEGNVGGIVGPDGAGNVQITGAGDIVVTGDPGTNSFLITNAGAAAQFDGDVGSAFPVAGILQILGSINILTTAAGNTVNIELADDIIINNELTVGSDIIGGGDISADGSVSAVGPLITNGGLLVTANGINSTGPVELHDATLDIGIVQIDDAGNLFSDTGAAGEFLISQGAGVQPTWSTLTSPLGTLNITYNAGTGNIDLEVLAVVDPIFQAKDATQAFTAANIIILTGDANINSTAAGNAITYRLADTIHVTDNIYADNGSIEASNGSIRAGDYIVAENNISSLNGSIIAFHGYVEAENYIISQGYITAADYISSINGNIVAINGNIAATAGTVSAAGDITSLSRLIAATGCDITGNVYLRDASLPVGITQMNALQQLYSSNAAADGQILIGSGAGDNPTWNNIVAGPGITITNGPHSVTVTNSGVGAIQPAFTSYLAADTGYLWGNLPRQYMGSNITPIVIDYDATGDFYAGDPVNPASFTAPVTALYQFIFKVGFRIQSGSYVDSILYIIHGYPAVIKSYSNSSRSYVYAGNLLTNCFYVQDIYMAAGTNVVFGIEVYHPSAIPTIAMTANTYISGSRLS